MKKRILIVSHALELGGAERSLVGLLNALDPDRVEVDLFLLRHEGELMNFIPPHINLLPEIPAYTVLARPMKTTLKEGRFLLTAARLFGRIKATHFDKKHGYTDSGVALEYSHKYTVGLMPKIAPDEEYDLAISFLTPHYIVAEKVRAKKKFAWIHTDYSSIQVDVESECKMWSQYDKILSISDSVTESFVKVFPELADKILLVENILPERLIRKQAEEGDADNEMPKDGSFRLLSIGRYCRAKNFDNVPEICSHLLQSGLDVKWYIIGFGSGEALIRKKIREWNMEERVILLGKKDNPYPYIKACDVYVQPSRYEGKSVTVREAQLLGKPVIITAYGTAESQLENGVDGMIVPLDTEKCAKAIAGLLKDEKLLRELSDCCRSRDYSNAKEMEKIYRSLENDCKVGKK